MYDDEKGMTFSHVWIKKGHFTNNIESAIIESEEKRIFLMCSSNIILHMKSGAASTAPFPYVKKEIPLESPWFLIK